MSNGISTRQNEESNIARLAAQRQLYRDVNRMEILNVVLTVAIPIGLSFVQDIVGWAKTAACIVSLVMLGLSFVIDSWQKEKKRLAATIQQEFDLDVFNMEWDRKLYGAQTNLNTAIAAASKESGIVYLCGMITDITQLLSVSGRRYSPILYVHIPVNQHWYRVPLLDITERRSRLSGGDGATCPD